MQRDEYDKRIQKARASFLIAHVHTLPNLLNEVRYEKPLLLRLIRRLTRERDDARRERDKALRIIARLAMNGVQIPKDE